MRLDAYRRLVVTVSRQIIDTEARAAAECTRRHGSGAESHDFARSFYGRHVALVSGALACSEEQARAYCRGQRDAVIAGGWGAALASGRERLSRLAWSGLGGCEMAEREVFAMVPEVLARWRAQASGVDPIEAMREHTAAAISPQRRSSGAVAVIPVTGMITQRPTLFSALFGGTSTVALADAVEAAVADTAVASIVLAFDSPGGTVTGVTEASARIRAARGAKPIIAIADPQAASAAYWLASAADSIYITPSGMAGSIGVYTEHVDESAALEALGVRVTTIKYGARKAEGASHEPLSEDALAAIQADVDYYGRMFESDVAKGRGVRVAKVQRDYGQGASLTADAALAAGLVDGIMSLDEVIAALAKGKRLSGPRAEVEAHEILADEPKPAPKCDATLWAIKWGL